MNDKDTLDSAVWGPHFWFVLHTIAYKYPEHPNSVTKRKYYDLIHNFPLFLPDETMGNYFATLLDKYPVTPYLDKRASFVRWMHFIHNKINRKLKKNQISFLESMDRFHGSFAPPDIVDMNEMMTKRNIVVTSIVFGLVFVAYQANLAPP